MLICLCTHGQTRTTTRPTTRGSVVEGYEYAIEVEKLEYDSGSPIVIKTTLTNLTSRPRDGAVECAHPLRPVGPDGHPGLMVLDEDGKRVELTQRGQKLMDAIMARGFLGTEIGPFEGITRNVELTELFDLSMPGRYSIISLHQVVGLDGSSGEIVASNKIKIHIRASPTRPVATTRPNN